MSAEGRMHYDHRGNENNSNKSAADALGSANTWNGGGVCSTDCSIPPTETRSEKPRNRHNQIWTKADKVDSKFSMIKNHITLWRTFSKYSYNDTDYGRMWKKWPSQLRKGHVWFTD